MGILLTMFQPACAASGPRLGAPGLVFSRIACAVANIDLEWSDVSGAMRVFRPFYGPSPVSPGAQRRLSRICEIHTPGQGGDVWRFNNFPWGIFDIPWREGVWVPTTKTRRSVGRNGMVLTFHLQALRQEGRKKLTRGPGSVPVGSLEQNNNSISVVSDQIFPMKSSFLRSTFGVCARGPSAGA